MAAAHLICTQQRRLLGSSVNFLEYDECQGKIDTTSVHEYGHGVVRLGLPVRVEGHVGKHRIDLLLCKSQRLEFEVHTHILDHSDSPSKSPEHYWEHSSSPVGIH